LHSLLQIHCMNQRALFLQHVAQTSAAPLALEISAAEGCYLYDTAGRRYLDLIGGISVCNMGHRHPDVVAAIRSQADQYLHVLVYGEFIQSPQVNFAYELSKFLPASLNTVYFTNSGAEATEGAMKLAKRLTGRTGMIAFNNGYHGSTQGALSIMGDEYWRNAFRPLLPGILHYNYNDPAVPDAIDENIACVVMETVQAESGVRRPDMVWIKAVADRCRQKNCLLVLDEIQAGFGRTGTRWAFEQYGVVPDILLLGKALGGGMPLGAFIASQERMQALTEQPVLGHITTFGGHPVSCAAGLAAFKALNDSNYIEAVAGKAQRFLQQLQHPSIRSIRSAGLWMALAFDSFATNKKVIDECLSNGLLTDWFLFAPECLRVAPPLTISNEQIDEACQIITAACNRVT
jgi:acetylornithine/succinyldiaminopimelate/putrescine aminotransferase